MVTKLMDKPGQTRMRLRVLDVETTGTEATDHVIEIAAIDLIWKDGELPDVDGPFDRLCKPPVPIPAVASAVHHIIDADVAIAQPWAVTWPLFIDDQVDAYVAHNCRFERQWFTDEITGGKPWICTYKCALRLWPDAPSHSNQALRYWLKLAGIDRGLAAHRAAPDVIVTAKLLARMLWPPAGEKVVTVEQMIKVSSIPAILPRLRFGKHSGKKFSEVPRDYLEWIVGQKGMDEDVVFTARHQLSCADA